MTKKRKVIIILILLVIIAEIVGLAVMLNNEGFAHISRIRKEKEYIIHEKELIPRETLTSFLIADDKFFLFYDYTGLVNVYDLDGVFLYGIQFQTGNNGNGNITYVDIDNCLYIYSRMGVIFAFDDRTFVRAFTAREDENQFDRIEIYMTREKTHSTETNKYYYGETYNHIFKKDSNGKDVTVIDMPQKNEFVYPLGMMILFSIFGFCAFLQNKTIPWMNV